MGITLLIADESVTIQKVIRLALAEMDVNIHCVGHLRDALAVMPTLRPQAVILSAVLPGAQSLDDFKILVSREQWIPTLVLHGTYDRVDPQAWRQAGFQYLLQKPFDSKELLQALQGLGLRLGSQGHGTPETQPTPVIPRRMQISLGEETGINLGSWESMESGLKVTSSQDAEMGSVSPLRGGGTVQDRNLRTEVMSMGSETDLQMHGVMENLVRQYCNEHLPRIVRDIVEKELRRLADERTRHLVDA